MKKLLYILILIIILSSLSIFKTQAVTQNAFDSFSTSLDIGNYMSTTYYRWKCNANNKCEKTQIKTDGDFDSESKCLSLCFSKTTAYTPSASFNSDFNFNSFLPTATTKASLNFTTNTNLNINNFQVSDSATPLTKKPLITTDSLSNLNLSNVPTTIPKVASPSLNAIDNTVSGSNIKPNTVKETAPLAVGKSLFTNLLQSLGIMKSTVSDDMNLLPNTTPTYPPEPQPAEEDWTWYKKEYAFKINKSSENNFVNYGEEVELESILKLRKGTADSQEYVGLLYSYVNEQGKRIFDNDDIFMIIPAQSGSNEIEYLITSKWFSFTVPQDIPVVDGTITIEALIVAEPTSYSYFKNPTNDYKTWRESNKITLTFGLYDKKYWKDYMKDNCNFKIISPVSKSIFAEGKDPYHTNFDLSLQMTCSKIGKTKFQSTPKDIFIKYKIKCPKQFNSDDTSWYVYQDVFVSGQKQYDIQASLEELTWKDLTRDFQLESNDLITLLNQNDDRKEFDYATPYGLSKRCDITMEVSNDGDYVAEIKDYFYLNQCKVNVINEMPNKTYCTENKDGNLLSIPVKFVFSNCSRDILNPSLVEYITFEVSPHSKVKPNIKDEQGSTMRAHATGMLIGYDKNGQTMYTNLLTNMSKDFWDDYFTSYNISKNMASMPKNVSFSLNKYSYGDNIFILPIENRGANQEFKIYYGSDHEDCINQPAPMLTIPSGSTQPGKAKLQPETKPNILTRIWNFLKLNLR